MLFNSFEFLLIFLPVTIIVYFILNKARLTKISGLWLVAVSLFFCGYFSVENVRVMLISVVVNYLAASFIRKSARKKPILVTGIVFNVLFLGYYKYADFVVDNINNFFAMDVKLQQIFLPLAISFFTFQQIAYLVDTYKGETDGYDVTDYLLFVAFFPKLISGPLVYHKDFLPQFKRLRNLMPNWENLYKGLLLFSLGLFKKVVIADNLSTVVAKGYALTEMTMIQAWHTSLSYSFQLYFDFSGYCDMAMGAALMLNIWLPINFNSPYKADSIQDFWHRWHITLSRWLMAYIYIPLGGNRKGIFRTYVNLFLVFLIGGFWHGAGWPFIVWGVLHGTAMVFHRLWKNYGFKMPHWCGYILTLIFVNIAWIYFRAETIESAWMVTKNLVNFSTFSFSKLSVLLGCLFWIVFTKYCINSVDFTEKMTAKKSCWGVVIIVCSFLLYIMHANQGTEFIYANF